MMKHLYKYIIIILVTIFLSIAFTSSHLVQGVDDLAYAIAIGIDVGENNNLKVTFQFTKPISAGESGTSETSPSVIDTVEANSFDSALSLMNTFVSKEINLSHCRIIVFSEEFARKGIGKEIYTFMNKVQFRPDSYVIISDSSAEEYLKSVSPSLENLVAKFYELLPRSSEYTGYTTGIEFGQFFNKMISNTSEPVAILRSYGFN